MQTIATTTKISCWDAKHYNEPSLNSTKGGGLNQVQSKVSYMVCMMSEKRDSESSL